MRDYRLNAEKDCGGSLHSRPGQPASRAGEAAISRRDGAQPTSFRQCPEPVHVRKRRGHTVCLHAGGFSSEPPRVGARRRIRRRCHGSLHPMGGHSTDNPYSWVEVQTSSRCPSMTSDVPPHTEATSALTEEGKRRVRWRAVPFSTPQPLTAYDRVRVANRVLSQNASPAEQAYEKEHDCDNQ